jgi:Ca2+-binding RTX toxin-like protein
VTNHTAQLVERGGTIDGITSFAEDGRGNLYVIGIGGTVSRLRFGDASADTGDTNRGGRGDDRRFGGAGDDTVAGGAGRDRLHGGAQDDRLRGGTGADVLEGAAGADVLDGGAGNDSLTGGGGTDTFRFAAGADTVTDFADDVDAIRFGRALGLDSVAEARAHAEEVGGDVVFSFGGGDVLTVVGTDLAALSDDLLV